MTQWKSDQLEKIGAAEELQIASVGRDGTLGKPTTIWAVRHGDDLYVRSVRGAALTGSALPRRSTRVGYGREGFKKTSRSSTPAMRWTARSRLPTGPSTAGTPVAFSTACSPQRRGPRPSSSCRALRELNSMQRRLLPALRARSSRAAYLKLLA